MTRDVALDGAESLQAAQELGEGCSEWALIQVVLRHWGVGLLQCCAERDLVVWLWCLLGQLS